jgi:hypothetical protein
MPIASDPAMLFELTVSPWELMLLCRWPPDRGACVRETSRTIPLQASTSPNLPWPAPIRPSNDEQLPCRREPTEPLSMLTLPFAEPVEAYNSWRWLLTQTVRTAA